MTNTKPTGGEQLRQILTDEEGYVDLELEAKILDWHNDIVLQEKRKLLSKVIVRVNKCATDSANLFGGAILIEDVNHALAELLGEEEL